MNIPRELVEQFAKGNGAIFVGAGLSIGAGLPGWGDLVSRLAAEIEDCPTDVSHFTSGQKPGKRASARRRKT